VFTEEAEMVAQPAQRRQQVDAALDALAQAGLALAGDATLGDALARIADAVAQAAHADVAVVRVLEPMGSELTARAVAASPAVAAELDGTRLPSDAVPAELARLEDAPEPIRRAAARVAAAGLHVVPVDIGDRTLGTVELYRTQPFAADERRLGTLAAGQVALALRAFGVDGGELPSLGAPAVELAGEALAVGADAERAAHEVTRLAAALTGAAAAVLWEQRGEELALAASHGLPETSGDLEGARALAAHAIAAPGPVEVERDERLPAGMIAAAALPLGEPALGVLQLLFADAAAPAERELAALATFAIRAAHALRAGARARELADELERTRALLAVVGEATARLSLAHTLETAIERVAELLGVDQLAVYLREGDRLLPASGRGLAGPHVRVAERLLELARGPLRGRGVVAFASVAAQPLLASVADAAGEAGIEAVVAVPLVAQEETIGLLAVYPRRSRRLGENDVALLAALAGQLAVAVQNAKLHEQAKELGEELEGALASERQAARQLGALYEISRSFAQSLSLDATLDAVTRTVVEVLDLDAAVIRMPDERREQLEARALHVADPTVAEAARALLDRPQPFGVQPVQRLFRDRVPFRLDEENVSELGVLLTPFLARGWTAAAVPVATPAEVIAALSLFSFRPGRPITDETIAAAVAIAGQAALAIDNARLYQQQKQFADTMQRSLLPRSRPVIAGLDVGAVYESAARVEVGGDVYDFLELGDGRLAVVLGDVTGHGIEATADMAMAKFVFRSLAHEHPEPADFLSAANDVVVDEIEPGKFITMAYVTIEADAGVVACAAAGHPPPRVVRPDASVDALEAAGLVLGVAAGQEYEEVRVELPHDGAVVLYTDGVIETRRDGELYGGERLDAVLAANAALPAQELARAVVEDCRAFAGGELTDDCAVVVIKRG
jgi:serine phosphatase RsbU (regulator of sigma subunit)